MRSRTLLCFGLVIALMLVVPSTASAGSAKKKTKDQEGWAPKAAVVTAPVVPPDSLSSLKGGGKFGLGLLLGSRTGLTAKVWAKRRHSLSLDVGSTNFTNSISFALSYHLYVKLFRAPQHGLSAQFYFGVGGRARLLFRTEELDPEDPESPVVINTSAVIGLRVPIGLSFLVQGFPIEVFIEAAPAIDLWTNFGLDLEGLARQHRRLVGEPDPLQVIARVEAF